MQNKEQSNFHWWSTGILKVPKKVWGHTHVSASPYIQLSRTIHLCLLTSHAALFRALTSGSH